MNYWNVTDSLSVRQGSPRPPAKRPFRGRKFLVSLLALVILGTAAWKIAEAMIHVDGYRPKLVEALTHATGVPASVDLLDVDILPRPSVHAYGIRLGEGELRIECPHVRADLRIRALLRGRIEVADVHVNELSVNLPDRIEVATEKWRTVVAAVTTARETPPEERPVSRISVGEVLVKQARVFIGTATEPSALWDAVIRGILDDTVTAVFSGVLPRRGQGRSAWAWAGPGQNNGEFSGDITYDRRPGEVSQAAVTGSLKARGLVPPTWPRAPWASAVSVDLDVQAEGSSLNSCLFTVKGAASPTPEAMLLVGVLQGEVSANIWLQEGALIANDIRVSGQGLNIQGDLTRHPDGRIVCAIGEGKVSNTALGALIGLLPIGTVQAVPRADASLDLKDWLVGILPTDSRIADIAKRVRLVKGTGSLTGLDVLATNSVLILSNVYGRFAVKEGVFHLSELGADGLSLAGTLSPDFNTGAVAFDLSGQAEIRREQLSPFLRFPSVSALKGDLAFTRAKGTFQPGQGVPVDLQIDGKLRDAHVAVETESFSDTFSPVQAEFTARQEAIGLAFSATSRRFGPLRGDGQFNPAVHRLECEVDADLAQLATLISDPGSRAKAASVLAAYGPSRLSVTADFPHSDNLPDIVVSLERRGQPPLAGDATFTHAPRGWALRHVALQSTLPLKTLKTLVPPYVEGDGPVQVVFEANLPDQQFTASADLSAATLSSGKWIRKKPGDAANVVVSGETALSGWAARTLRVDVLGTSVAASVKDGGVVADALNVNVAALNPLLPEGTQARGQITGSFSTSPLAANLNLREVGLRLPDGLPIDNATGVIAYQEKGWMCRDLIVRAANSDATLNLQQEGDQWRGTIDARRLDLSALLAPLGAAGQSEPAPPSDPRASKAFKGAFMVEAGELAYRRAHTQRFSAAIETTDMGVTARELSFQSYGGSGTGSATFTRSQAGTPGRFDITLALNGVDARLIDDLLEQPRDLRGKMVGTLTLSIPVGTGATTWAGLNGAAEFRAQQGSLGKMGMAAKVATVLRATELVRLRVPSFRDELAFDSCDGKLAIQDGFMTIHRFDLKDSGLAIRAEGTVDIPRENTNVKVLVNVLEGMTGLAGKVPLVGNAISEATKLADIRLIVSGRPAAPSVRVESGEKFSKPVEETTRKGGKMMRKLLDDAVDATGKAVGDILNR